MTQQTILDNEVVRVGWFLLAIVAVGSFLPEIRRLGTRFTKASPALTLLILTTTLTTTGCRKPFQPIKLEVIEPNEEAFLVPRVGDVTKQAVADREAFAEAELIHTKQVQIPQQWVQTGHNGIFYYTGEWRDAATLIRVSTASITREWTADPKTGTGNKNEAIWVMTSDQVEFSTGWTVTARVASQAGARKFLRQYPNGSLETVLDSEVRGKLQAEFGLEVTDLNMKVLRVNATPHILATVKRVSEHFEQKGISIINLGITGGFVYKNPTVIETMVRLFNAEQEEAIASAKFHAQEENNKTVIAKAQGEADAILKTKKAEADGVKLMADAKTYELEKAKENPDLYTRLKQLEMQRNLLERWDGRYPLYFMGGAGTSPNMLLQLPALDDPPTALVPEKKSTQK